MENNEIKDEVKKEPLYKNKNVLLVVAIVLVLAAFGFYSKKDDVKFSLQSGLKPDEAKTKISDFVKNNMVQPGTELSVKDITEDNGMYKATLVVGKQEIVSYLSKDGKTFYLEAYNIEEIEKKSKDKNGAGAAAQAASVASVKGDVPEVDLFVMSYCPYGTQIEKGMLPVVDLLGKKIKFNLKFVDYAMHGEKEVDENTRQYCIQKEEPNKLNGYLKCFLKKEDSSTECLKSVGVNAGKLASCVSAADAQFKIKENVKAGGQNIVFAVNETDAEKYGVKGSPTLIINGGQVSSGRDSASLLKAVCSGFNNPPAECQKELSSAAPAAGFGEGTGSNSAASCH